MYRRDAGRSGSNPTAVGDAPKILWKSPLPGRATQPVIAAGRVYVAVPERHHVVCLDEATGKIQWTFTADAPVSLSPTIVNGQAYFGGMDGWVYCLDTADGALRWRYLVAPTDRRICAFGQLESPWPVHGSVLVEGGQVYASAGRNSVLDGGIFVVALDAKTGDLRHEARLDGPHQTLEELKKGIDERYKSGLVSEANLNDIFVLADDQLFLLFKVFDRQLRPVAIPSAGPAGQRDLGAPHLIAHGGFTDTSLFNREFSIYSQYWWRPEEAKLGHWVVFDDQNSYALSLYNGGYPSHKMYNYADADTPAQLKGNPKTQTLDKEVLSLHEVANINRDKPAWSVVLPLTPRGLAQAGPKLCVIGIPGAKFKPEDPLAAVEDRGDAELWVLSSVNGEKLATCDLPATCVFDGMAAANGKVFAALMNGDLVCIGDKQSTATRATP